MVLGDICIAETYSLKFCLYIFTADGKIHKIDACPENCAGAVRFEETNYVQRFVPLVLIINTRGGAGLSRNPSPT
jgi:hypothetical protein